MRKFCLLLVAVLLTSIRAVAQIAPSGPPPIQSIDLVAINGWTLVTGTVADLETPFETWRNNHVTITVRETLKGDKTASMVVRLQVREEDVRKWKADASLLLIAIPYDPDVNGTAIDLSAKNFAALTADLKLLRKPDEAVQWVRKVADRSRGIRKASGFGLLVKDDLVKGTPLEDARSKQNDRGYRTVLVPVDSSLEQTARSRLNSTDQAYRVNAIQALGLFKSQATIELVMPLLHDEAGWKDYTDESFHAITHFRENGVRQQAYQTLLTLDQKVEPPLATDPPDSPGKVIVAICEASDWRSYFHDAFAGYRNLEELYLSGSKLAPAEWASVGALPKLQALYLEGSNVTDADLMQFGGLQNLRYLALTDTAVTDAGLLELAKLKSLRKVDLGQTVTENGIAALHKLRPDIKLRPDEFAFLTPLRVRRIQLPLRYASRVLPEGTSLRDYLGIRAFALAFPRDIRAEVAAKFAQEMPKRGWPAFSPGYGRIDRPLIVNGKRCFVDQIDMNPVGAELSAVNPMPGESFVFVTVNVEPRK